MKVLILGQAKSGTTALHRSVSDALDDPSEVFEPTSLLDVDMASSSLVVKHLFEPFTLDQTAAFDGYDKRLLLVRDPRDRLISWLLYDLFSRDAADDAVAVERFVAALRKKEAKPGGMSVMKLLHTYWTVTGVDILTTFTVSNRRLTDFYRRYGDQFALVRYESMVAGDMAETSAYLGVDLAPANVTGNEARVVRSRASGEWRQWFVRQDLFVFQPMCVPVLQLFGYEIDWDLPDERRIEPSKASEYVEGLVARRHAGT